MRIISWTIDSTYFQNEVNKFISENFILKSDIISITENNGFTTLWYYGKIKYEL